MGLMEFFVQELPNIGAARMNVHSRIATSNANPLDTG